eukprot:356489-Amphidinium_carterae.1
MPPKVLRRPLGFLRRPARRGGEAVALGAVPPPAVEAGGGVDGLAQLEHDLLAQGQAGGEAQGCRRTDPPLAPPALPPPVEGEVELPGWYPQVAAEPPAQPMATAVTQGRTPGSRAGLEEVILQRGMDHLSSRPQRARSRSRRRRRQSRSDSQSS